MMADYAGAVAAMRSRFEGAWSETPIAYQNEDTPSSPWPPVDNDSKPTPWVYFEVVTSETNLRGAGLPGDNVWLTTGFIFIHVFTPLGFGLPESLRLAGQAAEIFRAATFYRDGAGSKVLCLAPNIDGGASDADNGNWFRVTCSVPFQFFFRK
jgi:hypothetical protein